MVFSWWICCGWLQFVKAFRISIYEAQGFEPSAPVFRRSWYNIKVWFALLINQRHWWILYAKAPSSYHTYRFSRPHKAAIQSRERCLFNHGDYATKHMLLLVLGYCEDDSPNNSCTMSITRRRFTTSTASYASLNQKSSWSCWSSKGSLTGKTSTRQQYTSLPASHTYLQRHWLSSMKIGDPSLAEATYLDCIAMPWSSINIKASQHNLNSYYDLKHYPIKEYSLWHIIQHESSCCSKHIGSSWSTLYCTQHHLLFPNTTIVDSETSRRIHHQIQKIDWISMCCEYWYWKTYCITEEAN